MLLFSASVLRHTWLCHLWFALCLYLIPSPCLSLKNHFLPPGNSIPFLVQFSRSVMSNSLRPHGPQHARPPCPSPTPRVYSNSCPLSWWCHPTISSSVVSFSSCLQSFPVSGLFKWVLWTFFKGSFFPLGSSPFSEVPRSLPKWTQMFFSVQYQGLEGWALVIQIGVLGSLESCSWSLSDKASGWHL